MKPSFLAIVCIQLECLIGILFAPYQMLDDDQIKLSEGKGVLGHVAVDELVSRPWGMWP